MPALPDNFGRKALISFLTIAGVAAAWTLLYRLNIVFFHAFRDTSFASWIFLPAAIRLLSVLLFRRDGVIGLIAGALITSDTKFGVGIVDILCISTLSGLAPFMAIKVCKKAFGLTPDLSGLTPWQLSVFAIAGAFSNAILLNSYLLVANLAHVTPQHIIPIFVGDMIGTVIVLYGAALITWTASRRS